MLYQLYRAFFIYKYFKLHFLYIYIFTNLISTSIHGTRKRRKKTHQEQEIKVSWITARGEKEKIIGQKEWSDKVTL